MGQSGMEEGGGGLAPPSLPASARDRRQNDVYCEESYKVTLTSTEKRKKRLNKIAPEYLGQAWLDYSYLKGIRRTSKITVILAVLTTYQENKSNNARQITCRG
jgi:hypothetical protein